MKTYILKRTQLIHRPLDEVFPFFESAENLAKITPPWLNFVIRTPSPIEMKTGTLIEYTIKWFGFPVKWKTEIRDHEPPFRFADEQIRGPYRLWHHTHVFSEINGVTEMTDLVRYRLPFGPIGRIAHALLIRGQLQEIFDYRYNVIEKIFNENLQALDHS
jgi:ligand-binding SRPBCC domain-containing protein